MIDEQAKKDVKTCLMGIACKAHVVKDGRVYEVVEVKPGEFVFRRCRGFVRIY